MYKGVKTLIQSYKKPFNRDLKAQNKAKARLKEQGIKLTAKAVEEEKIVVLAEWALLTQRGTEAHNTIIAERVKKFPTTIVGKYTMSNSSEDAEKLDAYKLNKLEVGQRYLEKIVVDNQNMIIGYADEVVVDEKGYINVQDFKTHKEIRRTYTAKASNGFLVVNNFYEPVSNLVDCNFIECALQASFYMYTLWNHNKKLQPGKLTMLHAKLDEDTGRIIGKEVIELPYLIAEVKAIIQHLKENK